MFDEQSGARSDRHAAASSDEGTPSTSEESEGANEANGSDEDDRRSTERPSTPVPDNHDREAARDSDPDARSVDSRHPSSQPEEGQEKQKEGEELTDPDSAPIVGPRPADATGDRADLAERVRDTSSRSVEEIEANLNAADIDVDADADPDATPDGSSVEDPAAEEPSRGLFDDLLSGEPIFQNKDVLRPSYTPRTLPHREDQINNTATILVAALRGETPSNVLIYGKTGTGKTASAKYVSQELESTSQKYDVPCTVEYINCEVTDTQYRVLARLANAFIEQNREFIDDRLDSLGSLEADIQEDEASLMDTEFDSLSEVADRIEQLEADRESFEPAPMTGWPTDRVYSTFFEAVEYRERVVVIMLDEIDKLVEKSGDDTLYNLSRMNTGLDTSRVSIMGISNDLKFTDFLDPRVKSSLGEEEIVFPPYDANQLRDILAHRSDLAFEEGTLTEDVLPLCAAFAAQEHGDARRALDLLRTAGELAERGGADGVAEGHVRRAQEKIELDRVVEVVRTLPTQSKLVLFAIVSLEHNGVRDITTGEAYNIYRRLCTEIDADVLTQRRVTDLISELDMLGIVNAVVVSKGRYGRTKEISLSVPTDKTENVLLNDSRLADLREVDPLVQSRFDGKD